MFMATWVLPWTARGSSAWRQICRRSTWYRGRGTSRPSACCSTHSGVCALDPSLPNTPYTLPTGTAFALPTSPAHRQYVSLKTHVQIARSNAMCLIQVKWEFCVSSERDCNSTGEATWCHTWEQEWWFCTSQEKWSFCTVRERRQVCRVWSSHSGGYEESYLLWYNAV
jgi:hypothetical protein